MKKAMWVLLVPMVTACVSMGDRLALTGPISEKNNGTHYVSTKIPLAVFAVLGGAIGGAIAGATGVTREQGRNDPDYRYSVQTANGNVWVVIDEDFAVGECVEIIPNRIGHRTEYLYGEAQLAHSSLCQPIPAITAAPVTAPAPATSDAVKPEAMPAATPAKSS